MDITQEIQYAIDTAKTNGRKFESHDVTRDDRLVNAANEYIDNYEGTFGFMLSIKAKRERGWALSPAVLKGALNCLLAESQRQGQFRQETKQENIVYGSGEITPVVPDGNYTIVWDDDGKEYTTVRLKNDKKGPTKGRKAGVQIVSVKYGSDYRRIGYVAGDKFIPWRSFVDSGRQAAAITMLLESDNYETFGMAYAMQSGCCYRCGRQLEVPASLYRGLGPVCATLVGRMVT